MKFPKRKRTRLKNFDYSTAGYYFITICTHNRRPILSRIVGQGLAPAENHLSFYGTVAENQLLALETRYPQIRIDKYIIMPNHIHAIVIIRDTTAGASPCPTLSDIVCTFKSITTRLCHIDSPHKLFQTSFHDHIIRSEADYLRIWQYIDSNASKWETDCFFCPE